MIAAKEFVKTKLPFLVPMARKIQTWAQNLSAIQIQWLPSKESLGFWLGLIFASLTLIFLYKIARKKLGENFAVLSLFIFVSLPIFQALLLNRSYLLTLLFTVTFFWWILLQEKMPPLLKNLLLIITGSGIFWQFLFIYYPSILMSGNWQWNLATSSISLLDIYLILVEQLKNWFHYSCSFFTPVLVILSFLGLAMRKSNFLSIISLILFLLTYSLNLASGTVWVIFSPFILIFALHAFKTLRENLFGFFWAERFVLVGLFFLLFWQAPNSLRQTKELLENKKVEADRLNQVTSSSTDIIFLGQNSGDVFSFVGYKGQIIPFWSVDALKATQIKDLIVLKGDFEVHLDVNQKKNIVENWCTVGWTGQSVWLKSITQGECKYPSWGTISEPINFSQKFLLQDYHLSVSPNGKSVLIKTLWQSNQKINKDYKLFFQLVGPFWHERNGYPLQGWLKTSDWKPGNFYFDEQQLNFSEVQSGNYILVLGLYQEPGQDVLVNQKTGESFVRLETISIK